MKKITLIGSFSVALIAGMFALMSFSSSPNTEGIVYVRTFECFNTLYPSNILITDGSTIIKTVELEPMRAKAQSGNILKISTELNELKKQGYTLTSSNGGANDGVLLTNYIFEKK